MRIVIAAVVLTAIMLAGAGIALWEFGEQRSHRDGSSVSAAVQFALDKACGGNRERYYDLVNTLVAEQPDGQVSGTVLYEQFYDGDNFEGRMVMPTDTPSQTVVQSIVYYNGIAYWKWGDGPWEWKVSDRSARTPEFVLCQPNPTAGSAGASSSATEIVGDAVEMVVPGEYIDTGETLLDGVRTRHYVRLEKVSGAAPTPTAASLYEEANRADLRQIFDEVWIDDSGRLFRVNSRLVYPYGLVFRMSIQFSGYGEPNVITAPTLPTPTPSPTPTGTPTPTPTPGVPRGAVSGQ